MLPMRWACQAIADRVGADHQDDTLYLFWEEIMDVSAGCRRYDAGLRSLVEQRKQYFDYWLQRRPSLPKVVGTIPESVNDPILIEIFGLNSHFQQVVAAAGLGGQAKILTGVPASKGVGLATLLIADGDEVEVNGTSGQVTVLRSAAAQPGGASPALAGQGGG